MSIFKIYGKDFRIEPRQVGKAFFDVGKELVAVRCYPISVPPVDDMMCKLAAAFQILPPLVMVA